MKIAVRTMVGLLGISGALLLGSGCGGGGGTTMAPTIVGAWEIAGPPIQRWTFGSEGSLVTVTTYDFPTSALANAGCHRVETVTGATYSTSGSTLSLPAATGSRTTVQSGCASASDNGTSTTPDSTSASSYEFTVTSTTLTITIAAGAALVFTRVN